MIEKIQAYLEATGHACSATESPNIIRASTGEATFLVSVWNAPAPSREFQDAMLAGFEVEDCPHPYHWQEGYWNIHRNENPEAASLAASIWRHLMDSQTPEQIYEWWSMPYSTAYVILVDGGIYANNDAELMFLVEKI